MSFLRRVGGYAGNAAERVYRTARNHSTATVTALTGGGLLLLGMGTEAAALQDYVGQGSSTLDTTDGPLTVTYFVTTNMSYLDALKETITTRAIAEPFRTAAVGALIAYLGTEIFSARNHNNNNVASV